MRTREEESLRQLAKELGVSASYLSQVNHGKRPASQRLLSMLDQNISSKVLSKMLKYQVILCVGKCRNWQTGMT